MAGTMRRYCKAYHAEQLRTFPGWPDRGDLKESDILFVHDNLVVTKGIFVDEDVVYSDECEEWRAFCQETLKFQAPDY
jgi:hypothetical protein